jgi:hypothetical protein
MYTGNPKDAIAPVTETDTTPLPIAKIAPRITGRSAPGVDRLQSAIVRNSTAITAILTGPTG